MADDDALSILMERFDPKRKLTRDEADALASLRVMLSEIEQAKSRRPD